MGKTPHREGKRGECILLNMKTEQYQVLDFVNSLVGPMKIGLAVAALTALTGCVGVLGGDGYYDDGGYVGGWWWGDGGWGGGGGRGYDRGHDVHGYSARGAASRGVSHAGAGGGHGGGGGSHGGGGGKR